MSDSDERCNRGTLTRGHIFSENYPPDSEFSLQNFNKQLQQFSRNSEYHQSQTLFTEIMETVEQRSTTSIKSQNDNNSQISEDSSNLQSSQNSQRSYIGLYKMKQSRDDGKSPMTIEFKLHSKSENNNNCKKKPKLKSEPNNSHNSSATKFRENQDDLIQKPGPSNSCQNIYLTEISPGKGRYIMSSQSHHHYNKPTTQEQVLHRYENQINNQPRSTTILIDDLHKSNTMQPPAPPKPPPPATTKVPVAPPNTEANQTNETLMNRFINTFKKKNGTNNPNNSDPKPDSASSHSKKCESNKKFMPMTLEERYDIYRFDHGSAKYLQATDYNPSAISGLVAHQTSYYATRFWAEIFGSLQIGVTFFISFFLQAYRFLLFTMIRSLFVGFLQITADYFLKPLLTVCFNGFIQPPLILIYNMLLSIKDLLEPMIELFDAVLAPISKIVHSLRLVVIKSPSVDSEQKSTSKFSTKTV